MTPFEEIIWLFSSNKYSRGVCRLNIGEAALLYKYSKLKKDSHLLEIGRKFGGSTIIMASALDGGHVTSIDIVTHQKAIDNIAPLREKIKLITSDSKLVEWDHQVGLLFIDGDHHPKAVKRDIQKFSQFVENNGYMIFHDATKKSIHNLVKQSIKTKKWKKEAQSDSLVVLTRSEA